MGGLRTAHIWSEEVSRRGAEAEFGVAGTQPRPALQGLMGLLGGHCHLPPVNFSGVHPSALMSVVLISWPQEAFGAGLLGSGAVEARCPFGSLGTLAVFPFVAAGCLHHARCSAAGDALVSFC